MKKPILALLLATALPLGMAMAGQAPPAKAAAARLQVTADKLEIIELLLEYGRTLDRKDYAAYGKLFAREGEWYGGGAPAKGPAAIEERMRRTFGPVAWFMARITAVIWPGRLAGPTCCCVIQRLRCSRE